MLSGLNTLQIIRPAFINRSLTRCKNFRISSPSPLIQCSFPPSENLLIKFVRTFSQVVALVMLFLYHSVAGPRTKEENSAFFLKVQFASSPASPGAPPRANLIFRLISWIKGRDLCQKVCWWLDHHRQDEYWPLWMLYLQNRESSSFPRVWSWWDLKWGSRKFFNRLGPLIKMQVGVMPINVYLFRKIWSFFWMGSHSYPKIIVQCPFQACNDDC